MNELKVPNPMELASERVLTTKIIAEMYGTTEKVIRKNFERNKDHYTEGKHFYYLTGEDLKEFAHDNLTSAKARSLYLWTEKGALLHAKSLNTDKAWEVYSYLIEHYFRAKAEPTQPDYSRLSPQLQFMIQMEQRQNALEARQNELESRQQDMETKLKHGLDTAYMRGWKSSATLTREQQNLFRELVKVKAESLCGNNEEVFVAIGQMVIRDIYSAVHKRYGVKSYTQILMVDVPEVVKFISHYKNEKS